MLSISFSRVVLPVALQSSTLVAQQKIFAECPAALTPNAALFDPGDDRYGMDFAIFFIILHGLAMPAKENSLLFQDKCRQWKLNPRPLE